jgi:hypothetical protein
LWRINFLPENQIGALIEMQYEVLIIIVFMFVFVLALVLFYWMFLRYRKKVSRDFKRRSDKARKELVIPEGDLRRLEEERDLQPDGKRE